jgi:hypothetical protein
MPVSESHRNQQAQGSGHDGERDRQPACEFSIDVNVNAAVLGALERHLIRS